MGVGLTVVVLRTSRLQLVLASKPQPGGNQGRGGLEAHGLAPFQTARMYSGAIRDVALKRVFGVTTFELG